MILLFSSPFHTQFLQLEFCQLQFRYIYYILLFRSLTYDNCLYSAISVRLIGHNMWKTFFASCESVFELTRGLRDSQAGINNKDQGVLVKREAENICKVSSFLYVSALSSVICRPIHLFYASCGFQKFQKVFNQKISPRKRPTSNKYFVLLWT